MALEKPRKKKSDQKKFRLKKTFLQYLSGKRYTPLSFQQLLKKLAIAPAQREPFRKMLEHLVETGEVRCHLGKYLLSPPKQAVSGVINVLPRGFGFVRVAQGPDVFIPKQHLGGAIDGDSVEIEVSKTVSSKGPEGMVLSIIKRGRTHLAGIITGKENGSFWAYSPLLGMDKSILVEGQKNIREGDRVICQVLDWQKEKTVISAKIVRKIGHISDPSLDIEAAIEEFEIPSVFRKQALQEAKSFGKSVKISKGRRDLTKWEIVTIDPETAKDFDDAISLTKDKRGHFFLGVHIADVSHYVKPGSHLDQEAFSRCNSTYFPGRCVPMLPFELSNELCSLKPGVNRLTQSVFAEFNPKGELIDYSIERTCIKSQKRFSYEEALSILENKRKSPHAPLLKKMVELCHLLKKKRFERGSIDFAMPSRVVVVDEKSVPLRIETHEYDITHQMIEEFMLKANEIVAKHLAKEDKSLIYRVHEEPSSETFEDFYRYARSLGFSLPEKPQREDLQKLFLEAGKSPYLSQLSISFIRSMKLAAYSIDNLGHYGLVLEHYCHFTSPIRRYSDLIIQRLLFDEIPSECDIEKIALSCSEKERISFRAESSVTLLKKLRLASFFWKEDPKRIYEATITKIKPFALFFEVPLFDLEGNLHISEIGNDFYEFSPMTNSFKGARSGKVYSIGQKICVVLQKIDLIFLQSEWSLCKK